MQDGKRCFVVQLRHTLIMQPKEWTNFWHNTQLDIGFLHAYYVQHAYPPHSHDYYVISLIERGRQSFTHNGTKHLTPPGGVILINPGEAHTGEAVDEQGFELLSVYPTAMLMETAASELTGRYRILPFFKEVRIDHSWAKNNLLSLHNALSREASALEYETRILWTLTQLIKRYAERTPTKQRIGNERKAVEQACQYMEEYFTEGITLTQLARQVALSPYYFLRVFRAQVGMPPYTYLESLRIRHAQRLIKTGKPLVEVALEVGFNSQSHMTRLFKKIIGTTPGQYAQQVRD